jgi:hypothetical protein
LGGDFVTYRKTEIKFAFPELSDKKHISWTTHVDQHTKPTNALYDMILKKITKLLIKVLPLYPMWIVDPDSALFRECII